MTFRTAVTCLACVLLLAVSGLAAANCPKERLGQGAKNPSSGVEGTMTAVRMGLEDLDPHQYEWMRGMLKQLSERDPCYAPQYVEAARFELIAGRVDGERVKPEALKTADDLLQHALAIDPKLGDAHAVRGEVLRLQGDAKGAKAELGLAAQLGSSNPLLPFNQAQLAVDAGDCKSAKAGFAKTIANAATGPKLAARAQSGLDRCQGAPQGSPGPGLDPGAPPGEDALAKALTATCKGSGAARELTKESADRLARATAQIDASRRRLETGPRTLLQQALVDQPCSGAILRELARYAIKSGDGEGAERLLDRAIAVEPGYARSYVLAGNLYTITNRPAEARAALSKADALHSTDPWLDANWGQLLRLENKGKEAIARYERALANPEADLRVRLSSLDELAELYWAYEGFESFNKIQAIYQKAIALAPWAPDTHTNYARWMLCITPSNPSGAEANARAALKVMSYEPARQTLAAALYLQWSDALAAQDQFKAKKTYNEAAALYPGVPPVSVVAGTCRNDELVRKVQQAMTQQTAAPK